MKKFIGIILVIAFIFSSVNISSAVSSDYNTSIEEFAEGMSELYAEEVAEGKELEDSVACRVIVKATTKPDTYGYAECVVENNNLYIYQYSDVTVRQRRSNLLPYIYYRQILQGRFNLP